MTLKSFLLEKLFEYQKRHGFRPDYIVQNDQAKDEEPAAGEGAAEEEKPED